MKKEVLALILGGGQGARLFPLTLHRSKPAVPLGGKYRLIDITISNSINSGIHNIYVLTQFNSASLNHHIARTYRFSPFSDGFVEILAAEQTPGNKHWFQGTADAVRQVMIHIADFEPKNVLILSGDHLYQMDYSKFLKHHTDTQADLTVSVIPCDDERATGFGLLKTDPTGRIVEFREKPPADQLADMRVDTTTLGLNAEEAERRPYIASMGVYLFKYEALRELLKNEQNTDFGGQVIPAAISQYNVQAYLFNGYWEDIGTISSFYNANLDMASIMPKFNLFDADQPIYTRPRYLPSSKLVSCEINNSLISDGCILNQVKMRNCIVGIRARIESGTNIESSLLMGADFYQPLEELARERQHGLPWIGIGENTHIRRAIIDKNVRIGSNVKILNEAGRDNFDGEGGNYFIREGIVIVPKGATITDGTII
ncbi:MAG: glucose-1-phosphate adenylyltransferase [Acidobacteria bacterium]|nr:glucose-1-phosphate adenylyltransferase [Acidobacteriota bacterium]MBI3426755.1 glucose-1-phosphate adenylyltransferase [Acidobacteriota bacterium]